MSRKPLCLAVVGDSKATQAWLHENAIFRDGWWWRSSDGRRVVLGNTKSRFSGRYFVEVVEVLGAALDVVDYIKRIRMKVEE